MSSLNTISIDKLIRLIGTPACPTLIDVQTDEDFAADPRLVPGAVRRPWAEVADWAPQFDGPSAIVICQKRLKLSRGVAAWLRHARLRAEVLEGGALAWGESALSRMFAEDFCRNLKPACSSTIRSTAGVVTRRARRTIGP